MHSGAGLPSPLLLTRLAATGWMLAKVTLSYRLWVLRKRLMAEPQRSVARDAVHLRNARRYLHTSLRHGGAFLKLGQLLSARSDMLPAPWVDTLSQLQDQALPEPFKVIRQVLANELGSAMELFASFEETPLASASIGQVHRARLTDGTEVAVKIQRPGLEAIINLDITTLRWFLASIRSLLPSGDLDTITGEIRRAILAELDYTEEARWMTKARALLDDKAGIEVPRTLPQLCTSRVLTTEFVHADKLTTALAKRHAAADQEGLSQILERLLDAYFCQVLRGGFFQADPHPGNLLVTADNTVVMLDFGCTMGLPETSVTAIPECFRRPFVVTAR